MAQRTGDDGPCYLWTKDSRKGEPLAAYYQQESWGWRGVVGYVIDCANGWLPVRTPPFQSNTDAALVVWPEETRTVMV